MTRQYFSHHKEYPDLITNNRHIATLIISNFKKPEIPLKDYPPYVNWKAWLKYNPLKKAAKEIRK